MLTGLVLREAVEQSCATTPEGLVSTAGIDNLPGQRRVPGWGAIGPMFARG
jgi:hypothetical protein